MKRFSRILVRLRAESTKPPVLARAEQLARECGASIKLVEAMDDMPPYLRMMVPAGWDLPASLRSYKLEHLEQWAVPLRESGLQVSTEVLVGPTPIALIQEVLRHDHRLLMKDAETDGGDGPLGTVDLRLLRKCPCPVWLERPSRSGRKHRVLAAVDVMTAEPEESSLNREILELSIAVAKFEGAELHIVHAWRTYGEAVLKRGRAEIGSDAIDSYLKTTHDLADRALTSFLAGFGSEVEKARVHLIQGEAGSVIPALTQKERIDLVVMGTIARSGIAGVLIGNTAERIAKQLTCSILALKPNGFVSPITIS